MGKCASPALESGGPGTGRGLQEGRGTAVQTGAWRAQLGSQVGQGQKREQDGQDGRTGVDRGVEQGVEPAYTIHCNRRRKLTQDLAHIMTLRIKVIYFMALR
ncbi:unnamed protein product [Calypogeia fissa]